MEEYKYKVEFYYDIEKHVSIIYKINKKLRVFSIIGLIGSILFYLGVIIHGLMHDGSERGTVVLAILLVFATGILLSSQSKRNLRNRLIKIYGNNQIKFVYEFYDDYIKINKTGGDYESEAKMKYSNVISFDIVDVNLGYISTKEQTIIFLSGNQVKEIVEFVKSKK